MVDYSAPSGSSGFSPVRLILRSVLTVWILARVFFFTLFGLSLFILGFLGYFTLPFLFIGIALLLFVIVNTLMRTRIRKS